MRYETDILNFEELAQDHRRFSEPMDPGVPLDSDYWICTCGQENEFATECEHCHRPLRSDHEGF